MLAQMPRVTQCHPSTPALSSPQYPGHPGQHLSQPSPIVERPGQSLGLAQQGEVPPKLSQLGERASQREAELDGQYSGVVVLGQVPEGLEGLLQGPRQRCQFRLPPHKARQATQRRGVQRCTASIIR
jgi:hypothetical protein